MHMVPGDPGQFWFHHQGAEDCRPGPASSRTYKGACSPRGHTCPLSGFRWGSSDSHWEGNPRGTIPQTGPILTNAESVNPPRQPPFCSRVLGGAHESVLLGALQVNAVINQASSGNSGLEKGEG